MNAVARKNGLDRGAERALVEAVLAPGNRRADDDALYGYVAKFIQRGAVRVVRSTSSFGAYSMDQIVSDVMQTVWLKLYRRNKELLVRWDPDRGSLSAYVEGIAKNTARDWRKSAPVRHQHDDVAESNDPSLWIQSFEEGVLARAEGERAWAKLRENMSEVDCEIIRMRVVDGRSGQEIATATGLTRTNVHVRFHRLMQKARKILSNVRGPA